MRRILVLRGGALGDFIVTLPALLALRRKWPTAHIELIGNATAGALAVQASIIDRVESQHARSWQQLYQETIEPTLRERLSAYDLVINFWPDPAREIARHFPIRTDQQFITADPAPTHEPAARYFLAALAPLDLPGVPDYIALREPAPQRDLIALHPGSGSPRKNWPATRWNELAAWLRHECGLRVRFILGEAEDSFTAPAAESWANLPLTELADRLGTCRLYVGHDTGVSHLAAACGRAGLLLFGPTDPTVWAPPNLAFETIKTGASLDELPLDAVKERVTAMLADQR